MSEYGLTAEQKAIAEEYASAQQALESAQLTNVPSDPVKRAEHAIWWAQVSARQIRAYDAYQKLIRQMAAAPFPPQKQNE